MQIRCPNCGKQIALPADYCPNCRVNLREPPKPKKPAVPIWRRLSTLIIIAVCLAVVYSLGQRLLKAGAFDSIRKHVPDSLQRFFPEKPGAGVRWSLRLPWEG